MDEEELIARLSIEDAMSDVMSHIANASLDMADKLEQSGATISSAFDNMSSDVTSAVDSLSSAASNYDRMAGSATNSTDHWTSAVGNYDKSALEATHTTEQLVAEGFKAEDALFQEGEAALKAQVAMDDLRSTSEAAAEVKSDLSEVIEAQNRLLETDADASRISTEAKLELNRASREAAEAFSDLEKAQTFAGDATEKYDRAYANEQLSLEEVASAAEQARQAAEQLANAQERANKAAESLAKATDNASKSMGEFGDKSEDSEKKYGDLLEGLAKTAIFAEVISLTKDAAAAVYSLADAYSEAEKVIVNATGATGEALDNMDKSMMSAYSLHHAELSDTAGAIGEINTRMGLMGDKLTDMTGKFLDFSSATGSGTVTSVQEVTKVMNKWHVEQEDTVKVLDMLTYEAQKSGASVDNLASSLITGAASFQQVDLSLGSTISLLGELELQGINSSTVIMGLKTAVKNFSDDGLNAGEALRSTIDKIANMRSEAEATSLAIDTFGSRAGVELASAIRSGAITVEMLNTDLAEAEGTLKKTAEAGETLSEKWDKSSNKLKTAFTNSLEPALNKTSSAFSSIVGSIGDFLSEHETFTKSIVAIGTALGVAAVGVTTLTFAVNTAIPAIRTFVTTISATVMANPVAATVVAIAAVTAGVIALSAAMSDGSNEVADYEGTLEQCSKEIESTRAAHEKAVELYGEESDAAKQLEGQLETLNAQYEKGGGVAEDYAQRLADSTKKFNEFKQDYSDSIKNIEDTATSGLIVASQLETLSEKSNKTEADLKLMGEYADYLNDTFECNIKVNYDTGELTNFDPIGSFEDKVQEITDKNKQEIAIKSLADIDFQKGYKEDIDNLAGAEYQIKQFQDKLAEDVEKMVNIKSGKLGMSDYLEDFASSNQNEKYDFLKLYSELGVKDMTGNNPFRDDASSFFFPWDNPSAESELNQFYKDFEQYNELLKTQSGYEQRIAEKNRTIKELHDTAGMSGGEDTYIDNLKKEIEVGSLSDYITKYRMGITNAAVAQNDFDKALNATNDTAKETAFTLDDFGKKWYEAINDGNLSMDEMTEIAGELPSEVQAPLLELSETVATLGEEYIKTGEAIQQSFEGQFDLFDRVQESTTATIDTLKTAQSEQFTYWQNYNSGIEQISKITADTLDVAKGDMATFELGMNALKQKLSDGTAESKALMEDININIKNKNEEAVKDVILALGKTEEERNKASENTAKWVTDIDKKMGEAYDKAKESIDQIDDLSVPAHSAAIRIMDEYKKGIEDGGKLAINKAKDIATGITNALSNVTVPTISAPAINSYYDYTKYVQHNATGTTNADDVFIAGENGPELIVGKGGSTVFPTSETEKILNAVGSLGRSETASLSMGSNFIPEKMNGLDGLTDRLERVFIPVLGKTVKIASDMISIASRDMNVPEREQTLIMPTENEYSFDEQQSSKTEKKITIEVQGSGSIEIEKGADKETMLEVLQENLKPVLMNIISSEIYEEGDDSYDY